jgi:hypothetical protein
LESQHVKNTNLRHGRPKQVGRWVSAIQRRRLNRPIRSSSTGGASAINFGSNNKIIKRSACVPSSPFMPFSTLFSAAPQIWEGQDTPCDQDA